MQKTGGEPKNKQTWADTARTAPATGRVVSALHHEGLHGQEREAEQGGNEEAAQDDNEDGRGVR